jgi:hypothetical protein
MLLPRGATLRTHGNNTNRSLRIWLGLAAWRFGMQFQEGLAVLDRLHAPIRAGLAGITIDAAFRAGPTSRTRGGVKHSERGRLHEHAAGSSIPSGAGFTNTRLGRAFRAGRASRTRGWGGHSERGRLHEHAAGSSIPSGAGFTNTRLGRAFRAGRASRTRGGGGHSGAY